MPRLLARRVVNIEHDSFLGDAKHLEIQTNWTRIPHIPSMINVATSPATTAPPTMNRSANALLTPCAIMTSRPPAARCARTTFACDVAYWITGNANWAIVTLWLLGAGIIMGALAALAGLTDLIGEQRIRALNDAWLHAGGMVTVVLIEIYNWYARYTEGAAAILPKGIILSLVAVCILLFAGWMGWNMVYRHRVGIADEAVAVQSSATQRRAA